MGCFHAVVSCAPTPLWHAVAEGDTLRLIGPGGRTAHILPGVSALAWGRDGVSLYAVSGRAASPALFEIRRSDAAITARVAVGSGRTSNIAIDRRARALYVANGSDVQVFALAPLRARRSIPTCDGQVTAFLLFEADDSAFALCDDGVVREINTSLHQRDRTTQLPQACRPEAMHLSPSESLLVIPCSGIARTYRIDRVAMTIFDSLPALAADSTQRSNTRHVRNPPLMWPLDTPVLRFLPATAGLPTLDPAQP